MIAIAIVIAIMLQAGFASNLIDRALQVEARASRLGRIGSRIVSFWAAVVIVFFLFYGNATIAEWVLS